MSDSVKMNPQFVKGRLTVKVDSHVLTFENQNISTFGVSSLPWGPLSSDGHFGRVVEVEAVVPSMETASSTYPFKTRATIQREKTVRAEHMCLKFHLNSEQRARITELVEQWGHYPTEYVRKYPRIPSSQMIQTFPLRALGRAVEEDGYEDPTITPIVFDIENISPNGLLLQTENQLALTFNPGDRLDIILEPRGRFHVQITIQGMICRILDEKSETSGNLVRHFGIKFTRVDEANRATFLELLKDILERMKK